MKLIVKVPNHTLIKPALKIIKITKEIKQIIADMKQALISSDNPKGIGLAAPQIGVSLRIFLMRPEETNPIRVFINPEIVAKSKTMIKGIPDEQAKLEGCLSVPKVWGTVLRHKSVTLKFMDETGASYTEKFTDFTSVIVQHEMDHLNGILFTRRVVEQKGRLYEPSKNDKGEEVLIPIDI